MPITSPATREKNALIIRYLKCVRACKAFSTPLLTKHTRRVGLIIAGSKTASELCKTCARRNHLSSLHQNQGDDTPLFHAIFYKRFPHPPSRLIPRFPHRHTAPQHTLPHPCNINNSKSSEADKGTSPLYSPPQHAPQPSPLQGYRHLPPNNISELPSIYFPGGGGSSGAAIVH